MASLTRDHVPSARPIAAKEVPLVNRTEEMNVLKEAVYGAVHGEGGLVFIHGEAGIGKTRLVRELGAYARSRGVQVLYGRCPALFRMDGVPPYILWKEVIKDFMEACTSEQLFRVIGYYPAEVAKLVPELSQKLRTIPQSFPISPEQEQNRLFEAVSQFITNISREAPLLVVLDDLQWTDPSSLLLLHYLARGVQKTQLLLLGAYRSTDIDANHPLSPVLAELNRERLPQSIHLKRMSLSDVTEIVKSILEQEDVPEEFCRLIYEKTKGNPFFAEEVVKSLKEEEVIVRKGSRWEFKDVSKIEFPETVKSVLKARFSRLDNECQNVLTLASFVGNEFTLEAMAALTGFEEDKLLDLMDRMLKTGLIKEREVRGEGVCSFADILVRDVVYEEVSLLKRKKLHGVVGGALEKVYAPKIEEHLGELAAHFLESGDKDKALDYFLKAGERAQTVYANAEAASYFQSALRLLEEVGGEPQEKGRVLERLGDIKKLVGEYDACLKYWSEALPLLTEIREKAKTAALHRKMANVLWDKLGNARKAKEHHDACLKILETQPENVETARLYHDMAYMQWRNGDFAKALASAEKALVLAEKLNALDVVADACLDLACVLLLSGDRKKALEYASRGLKTALDNGYLEIAVLAYERVGGSLPFERYEDQLEYFEKGLALAKQVGDTSRQSWFLGDLADIYTNTGKLDKAIALEEEALALDRRVGSVAYTPGFLVSLGNIYQLMGEWSKSEQLYDEAAAVARELTDSLPKVFTLLYRGWLHLDKEEYARARELCEEAVKAAESLGNREIQMRNCWFLSWACIELGETGKAESLLDSVKKYALETGDTWHRINEMALRAMLLRAQKKRDASLELFEKTLREWKAARADIWFAYFFPRWVLCEYARAHLERNEEGDKERARSLLNRALEKFREMGARKDIEKVEARLLSMDEGKAVSASKPEGLVATGFADLDKLLYGGIRSSSAVVLASPSCNERDSLVEAFLGAGAEKGEVTFHLTTSVRAARTRSEQPKSNFFVFVCNPHADVIAEGSPGVFKLKGVENLTEISIALTSAIHRLDASLTGPRRACIEIVSDVLLQHRAVHTRKWLTAFTTELTAAGFTVLAVVDPQMHPPEELHAVLGLFDGEITLLEKGAGRFLKIKRMSGQQYLDDELPMKREDPQKR